MLPKIGPLELVIILVIVTMLFGVGRLPEVFGAVGRGVREFRRASSDGDEDTPSKPAQVSDESSDAASNTTSGTTADTTADTSTDKPAPQA